MEKSQKDITSRNATNGRDRRYVNDRIAKKQRPAEIVAGIYEEYSHRVVNVNNCYIQNQTANEIVNFIKKQMKSLGIAPYNEDTKTGTLRHVYVRVADCSGDTMVVLVSGDKIFSAKNKLVNELTKNFPAIKTVALSFNDKKTSMVLGDKYDVLFGPGYIEDKLCGNTFRISPKSFYQVNPKQTEILYNKALEFASIGKEDTVLDLFCGIGTISLLAAQKAKEVIGVEINSEAISDARINAKLNKIENTRFFTADATSLINSEADIYKSLKEESNLIAILDPPRNGCDEKMLIALSKLNPKHIVYVSCNPETQRRDAEILRKNGYAVKKIQAVDMFPQTSHVETVVLFGGRA